MKYWDPQASSVKKFVDLGLGTAEQYTFSALSNKLLGQAQPKQFQAFNDEQPLGWYWGSKCTPIYDEVDTTKIINTNCDDSASIASNILAAFPRSYIHRAYGGYYNYFVSTAESGTYSTLGNASDSICPSGWELPKHGENNSSSKTWKGVLFGVYGMGSNVESSNTIRHTLSLIFGGFMRYQYGDINDSGTGGGYYNTSSATSSDSMWTDGFRQVSVFGNLTGTKANGYSIRCILK